MIKELKDDVPRGVVVENDGWLGGEVLVQSLIADEDGDGLEDVFQAGAGGEDEGVGFDDFFLDVREGDSLVAVGIIDVPTGIEEVEKELGAGGAAGVVGADNSSGKASKWHE